MAHADERPSFLDKLTQNYLLIQTARGKFQPVQPLTQSSWGSRMFPEGGYPQAPPATPTPPPTAQPAELPNPPQDQGNGMPAWVLPVAIGGGLLVLALVLASGSRR